MRRIFFLAVSLNSCFLWISCGKESMNKPMEFPKVTIDSIRLLEFDDVSIAASYQTAGSEPIIKKGFCWSTAQNPDINDSKSDIAPSASFSDTIYDVGEKATIYFRAYVQTADSIYYSENGTIVTGGLDNTLISDINDGRVRHIWQVIETPDNQFLQLIIVVGPGVSWPQVTKLDRAGNVVWKHDYFAGEHMIPDQIMSVADGYMFVASRVVLSTSVALSLVKIDFNGVLAWEKPFVRKTYHDLIKFAKNPGDQIMLTMLSYDGHGASGRTNCSFNELIVDLSGNLVSEKTVPVNNNLTLKGGTWLGADITGDGFFISGHYTDGGSNIFDELAVQKYDADLQLEWEKLYKKAKTRGAAAVSLSPAGDYDILGLISQNDTLHTWMFEIDKSSRNIKWEFTYDVDENGLPVYNFGKRFIVDPSGNYYIFGDILDAVDPGPELFVVKLDANGKKVWNYRVQIPRGPSSQAEAILKQGNDIYLFGNIDDQQTIGSNSLFMIKLTEN